MITDKTDLQANQLSAVERKQLAEERLLETAVIDGSIKVMAALIKQGASVNVEHIDTSLLATAIMNKQAEVLRWLLTFNLKLNYLITASDIEEIRELISDLEKIKASGALGEENKAELNAGLAVLRAFNEAIQDHHFKMINDKISDITAEISTAIITFSPPSANGAPTATVASPRTLLHAFQDVNVSAISIDMLFSLIAHQEFDKFSALLNWLISQNAMFDINAADKDGKTLLHHASINVDNQFLKALLEKKANPNIGDKYGWTPVHLAAFTGNNFNIFKEANIAHSIPINWNVKTLKGETIFRIAERGKKISKEILEVISSKISNTAELKNAPLH